MVEPDVWDVKVASSSLAAPIKKEDVDLYDRYKNYEEMDADLPQVGLPPDPPSEEVKRQVEELLNERLTLTPETFARAFGKKLVAHEGKLYLDVSNDFFPIEPTNYPLVKRDGKEL